MFDYDNFSKLRAEVDEQQAAGNVSKGKAYALMTAFDTFLDRVKPTGYEVAYSPTFLYYVVYCENGEKQPAKGWVDGLTSYSKATMIQWALKDAYKQGQQSKGGNNDVF